MATEIVEKACNVKTGVKNTGKECDTAMKAAAMIIALNPSVVFTLDEIKNAFDWLNTQVHKRLAFPLFGNKAPIQSLANNPEPDVTVTLDDGSVVFIRYGMYVRTFGTAAGGLCYAQSLASFLGSGYTVIEVDSTGQATVAKTGRKNSAGKALYTGMPAQNMFSPAPQMADLRSTVYMNRFQYSLNPTALVNDGLILKGFTPTLSMMGLIDSDLSENKPATTTKMYIDIKTDCAETNLVSLFNTDLVKLTHFTVRKQSDGSLANPTAVVISGTAPNQYAELTGAWTANTIYEVTFTDPETLRAAKVEGYDVNNVLEVKIP